ncbi:hypothetical protein LJ207_02525 [Halanaerobium sp. Z-7514]|uniref:Uncharacterized protein n=1 Tax=Halanaerobium polyolivorans TaxID=2886943 RepID=A0AAW4WSW1_9FIRM|nr:hypothetical protein [Halanaerobium polyolivorans]MCC3144193.1 hypothetical protein [Halanaerobium polyolivorans]
MKRFLIFITVIFIIFLTSPIVMAQLVEVSSLNYYTARRIDVSELRFYGNPTPNLFDYNSVIIGEVRNNSTEYMTKVQIKLEIYDGEDLIAEKTVSPLSYPLVPGQTTPFIFPQLSDIVPLSGESEEIKGLFALDDTSEDWDSKKDLFLDPRIEIYVDSYEEDEYPPNLKIDLNNENLRLKNIYRSGENRDVVNYDYSIEHLGGNKIGKLYNSGIGVYKGTELIYLASSRNTCDTLVNEDKAASLDYSLSIPKHIEKNASNFRLFATGQLAHEIFFEENQAGETTMIFKLK